MSCEQQCEFTEVADVSQGHVAARLCKFSCVVTSEHTNHWCSNHPEGEAPPAPDEDREKRLADLLANADTWPKVDAASAVEAQRLHDLQYACDHGMSHEPGKVYSFTAEAPCPKGCGLIGVVVQTT